MDCTPRSGIYSIVNLKNGKQYIGKDKTLPKRWSAHKSKLNRGTHHNQHLQSSWNKYGESYFVYSILEYHGEKGLKEREQWWMDLLNTLNPKKGYNKKDAEDHIVSEETKLKISTTLKGRTKTPEHLEKISRAKRGMALSAEHIEKISYANKGKSRNTKSYELTSPNGDVLEINNLTKFCFDNKLDQGTMSAVALNKRSQHKGWRARSL